MATADGLPALRLRGAAVTEESPPDLPPGDGPGHEGPQHSPPPPSLCRCRPDTHRGRSAQVPEACPLRGSRSVHIRCRYQTRARGFLHSTAAGAPETQLEMLSPTAATDKARSTHRSLADAP